MPRRNRSRDDMVPLLDTDGATRKLASVERDAVMFALHRHSWNITAAARALGVTKVTVYAALRRYGIDIEAIRKGEGR